MRLDQLRQLIQVAQGQHPALAAGHRALQTLTHHGEIGQPGQRVMQRVMRQLLFALGNTLAHQIDAVGEHAQLIGPAPLEPDAKLIVATADTPRRISQRGHRARQTACQPDRQ